MKFKVCLAILLIVFSACRRSVTGPDMPEEKTVEVKYVRVPPITNDGPEFVSLCWSWGQFEGGDTPMQKVAEDTFAASIIIKTETGITMHAFDTRKSSSDPTMWKYEMVCKRFFIEGQELIFQGSEYGRVTFLLHNNGTVVVMYPR